MPARREFHTGRPNFLHCGWGPIEPFDASVPAMLTGAGVTTHLATDHYHYFEDGGATYHTRYGTWQGFRGQEGDPVFGLARDPHVPDHANGKGNRQDWVNREFIRHDHESPQSQTFAAGLAFIDRNAEHDRWFLQIEAFDPHEPFTCDRRWTDRYGPIDDPVLLDWPNYGQDDRNDAHAAQARQRYAALVTKCDAHLGDVLDAFDRHDLWEDTMLVVWTDHGFMLGERDRLWAKNVMPLFDDVANTPLFVHDPRHPAADGDRRRALVQPAIDLGPTLLAYFGVERDPHMLGHDLEPVVAADRAVRDHALYGYHANRINITDGRYTYFKTPEQTEDGMAFNYTLMPTAMRGFKRGLDRAELAEPFSFTRGMPTLRLPAGIGTSSVGGYEGRSPLYDRLADPGQTRELDEPAVVARLERRMAELMHAADAPDEQYARMGLTRPSGA
jgi:arylsulfatase A-like enzyme